MAARIEGEAPGRALQLFISREIGLDCIRVRHCRMEIDRHIQRLRGLEDAPEFLLVEESALGVAVNHRAFEAELLDATLQLARRGVRIRRWQRGEAGEAI